MADESNQWGVPPWWPMVVSSAGIVALFSSHALQLSDATLPIIGVMIVAGPAVWGDRILRKRGRDDE